MSSGLVVHFGKQAKAAEASAADGDGAWNRQQARNFLMHAEDIELPPKLVMRDIDGKFSREFDQVFQSNCAEIKRNTPVSPQTAGAPGPVHPIAEAGMPQQIRYPV